MPALAGMAVVLVTLGALFVGIRIASVRFHLHPEIARKALHVGMGVLCLGLPSVFHEDWPVVVLATLAVVALLALRIVPRLHTSLGQVLHGVERGSLGEFYFILGVASLFVLARTSVVLYVVPLLWLTFADATAALVGIRYGTIRYSTHDGKKSLEGSSAFAVVTFATTFVALIALGYADVLRDSMIGAIAGILAMLLEAVVWDGFDNLAIPVVGYAILSGLLKNDVAALTLHLGALIVLASIVFWRTLQTTLSDDALLASVLSGFALWDLGGWVWLIAPATIFIKDKVRAMRVPEERRHDVHAVMATCGIGIALALAHAIAPQTDWFYAYTLSFAVTLALFDMMTRLFDGSRSPAVSIAASVLVAFVLSFVPYALILGAHPVTIVRCLVALPIIALCCVAFYGLQPGIGDCPRDAARWIRQTSASGIAAVLGIAIARAL